MAVCPFPLPLARCDDEANDRDRDRGVAAVAADVPIDTIAAGLAEYRGYKGRLQSKAGVGGSWIIDDTYNANPASLYSALQVLTGMQGVAWLVLGDMKELGEDSQKLHAEVGEAAKALGVSRIFATGDRSVATVKAFGAGARHFSDKTTLIETLKRELHPGVNCLIKGSRSMAMEQVVRAVTDQKKMREAC